MELGSLIFTGNCADVYEVDEHWVLKVDRPGHEGTAEIEHRMLDSIDRGVGPRSGGLVQVNGRQGVLLERLPGDMLYVLAENGDAERLSLLFAEAHLALHMYASGLPDLISRLESRIRESDLGSELHSRLIDRLHALDTGERLLCHGDYHPANVIVHGEACRVIDWVDASAGPPIADLARTVFLMRYSYPPPAELWERMISAELGLRGVSEEQVELWMPIIAAARLSEGFEGEEAERLREAATSL